MIISNLRRKLVPTWNTNSGLPRIRWRNYLAQFSLDNVYAMTKEKMLSALFILAFALPIGAAAVQLTLSPTTVTTPKIYNGGNPDIQWSATGTSYCEDYFVKREKWMFLKRSSSKACNGRVFFSTSNSVSNKTYNGTLKVCNYYNSSDCSTRSFTVIVGSSGGSNPPPPPDEPPPPPSDNTDPSITITSPANYSETSSSSITVSGNAYDQGQIDKIKFYLNGGYINTIYVGSTSSNWSQNFSLREGQNTIKVKAYDYAGNSKYKYLYITKKILDNTPPTLNIYSPTNGSTVSTQSINVNGYVDDKSGINSLQWSNNRGGSGYIAVATNWSQTGIPLKSGDNTITITAIDNAGNPRTAYITVIYISAAQNRRPYIDIISMSPKATPGQNYTVQLRPYDPDNNIRSVAIDWTGNGSVQVYNVFSNQAINTTHNYSKKGSYTWTATAYDSYHKPSASVCHSVLVGANNFDMGAVKQAGQSESGACGDLVANPINPAMGSQVVGKTFLKVQGVIPISFTLTYNSILLTKDVVGTGWGINRYETRLRELSNGDVEVHWNANRNNLFKKQGSQFMPVQQYCQFDKLVKNSNGTFTLLQQNKTIYEFNADGQLLKLQNSKSQALTFQYDSQGRLSQIKEPVSGVYLNYTYGNYNLLATVKDSLNRQVRLSYDANHNLISITDPANRITRYTYNEFGQKLTTTLDGVLQSSNTYDPNGTGRIVEQEDNRTDNQPIRFAYDKSQAGKIITTVTGRNGDSRVYTYNDDFQLLSLRDRLGKTVTHTYDGNGKRTATTDANGKTTRFNYDSRGNLISVTNAANHTSELIYDARNNLISSKNALNEITQFAYDGNNNLIRQTNPLGKVTGYTYNSSGKMLTMTNPLGKRTTYQYQTGRDVLGRVESVTDADGSETRLNYDVLNRLISITDPLNRTIGMTYYKNGNLLTFSDANGNVTRRAYDDDDNLIS
jgi:YD repeat-containing protein